MSDTVSEILQVSGLTKRYGEITAVDQLSLDVHKGEVFGLLGPNGAGKTTTIQMICGFLKPDAGQVLLQGETMSGSDTDLRTKLGVCPQEIVLWKKLTALEQLQFMGEMYGLKSAEARRRGLQLLELLGLSEKARKLAKTLSGGMQRRLNLAMALVHNPQIIILDEPEAGLDPQSRVQVRQVIKQLAREKTIILTTHNIDEADRLADRVAIIDHGKLLVLDSPEALKRSVGTGDVLEIALKNGGDGAAAALADMQERATITQAPGSLHVQALDVMSMISTILEKLAQAGIQTGEVRLRENTLEDVFIRLTGRRLRE